MIKKLNFYKLLLMFCSLLLAFSNPSFPMDSPENTEAELAIEPSRKKIRLEKEQEEETSVLDLHSFSHTHQRGNKSSEFIESCDLHIKGMYVAENSFLTYEDWEEPLPFIDSDDNQLLKHVAHISNINSGSENILFLSIQARVKTEHEEIKWVRVVLHYDTKNKRYALSPLLSSDEYNVAPLHLAVFKSCPLENERQNEIYSYVPQKPLSEEIILPSYTTYKNHPHTEIQALNILFTNKEGIFEELRQFGSLLALIIKFHSYNDICEECQNYLLRNQPYYKEIIAAKFDLPRLPFIFCGIANKPYGFTMYYHKSNEPDSLCQGVKSYSNNGYTVPLLDRVIPILKRHPDLYPSIEEYVSLNNYTPFTRSMGSYHPYSGKIGLPLDENGKQASIPIFIKRPDLSALRGKLSIKETEREDCESFSSVYSLKLELRIGQIKNT